jgi:hypothetical protein
MLCLMLVQALASISRCSPQRRNIWLDNDRQKLHGFQTRASALVLAVLGDGTRIGLRDKSVDYATCIAVTHQHNRLATRGAGF